MKGTFPRRTFLYTPGSSLKMIGKAKDTRADSIILDLEDSVSLAEKPAARENVIKAIPLIRAVGKEIVVRVNEMNSMYGIRDVIALASAIPDALIIPKADERSLIVADTLLTALEEELGLEKDSIKLIPLLETARGIINASVILNSVARISGVQLGAEDLTKELEIDRTRDGEEISFARSTLVLAGRACEIDIIDTPFTSIKDLDGLAADAKTAKAIGFTGKTCIHPDQIDTINQIYSPSEESVQQAKNLIAALEAKIREGKGACMFEGKMIDAPIAERAQKLIQKANRINSNI